jgi:hypothetical protein
MIALSSDGRILRRRMPSSNVPEQASRLVAAFAAPTARLLLKTEASVEIAHEALFRRWTRLSAWIAAGLEQLRSRQRVENAYRAWISESGDKNSRLLPPGKPLSEAEELLNKPLIDASEIKHFILESISHNLSIVRRQHRRVVQSYIIGGITLIYIFAVLLFTLSKTSEFTQIILFCMIGVAVQFSRHITKNPVVFVTITTVLSAILLGTKFVIQSTIHHSVGIYIYFQFAFCCFVTKITYCITHVNSCIFDFVTILVLDFYFS